MEFESVHSSVGLTAVEKQLNWMEVKFIQC